jgi:hypothetical protein
MEYLISSLSPANQIAWTILMINSCGDVKKQDNQMTIKPITERFF